MIILKLSTAFTFGSQYRERHDGNQFSQSVPAGLYRTPNAVLPFDVALDTALDAKAMVKHLLPRLRPLGQSGNIEKQMLFGNLFGMASSNNELTIIQSELLDCKPGKRALVRYELMSSDGESITVFGKLYTDPNQLARVDQVLSKLWHNVFSGDVRCAVPQPMGVIPELSMFIYKPAEGRFLDQAIADTGAESAMDLTAQWLSTLHRYPMRLEKQFDLENELNNLRIWTALVARIFPEMAVAAHQLLDYLQRQAAGLSLETQTPIHKDFHYRHVLIGDQSENGVKAIDFDEMRLGDPNFDLGHFCANLHLLSYRQHGSPEHLRNLEQRFLNAYAQSTGWEHCQEFTYFYVYTCLKIARQLCLGVGPSPIPNGQARQRQVEMILEQGLWAISEQ